VNQYITYGCGNEINRGVSGGTDFDKDGLANRMVPIPKYFYLY